MSPEFWLFCTVVVLCVTLIACMLIHYRFKMKYPDKWFENLESERKNKRLIELGDI